MRKIILIIISVLIYANIKANEFIQINSNNSTYGIRDFGINNNENYLVGYRIYNNGQNSCYINIKNNEIKDYKDFKYSGKSSIQSITFDNEGNKYLLETILNGNSSDNNITVSKLNINNEIISNYYYGRDNTDDEFKIIKFQDGFLYLIGTSTSTNVVIKLDMNLNQVWCKEFKYSNTFYMESYYFEKDKIIMVGWDRYNRGDNSYTLIQSVDLNGILLNYKIHDIEIKNYDVRNSPDMVKIENGYMFFLRRYQDNNKEPYLIKFDNQFNILNIYKIEQDGFENETVLVEDFANFYIVNSNNEKSFIHKFSKVDLKYQKSFYLKELESYKINRIKLEGNNIQVSGSINNSDFFLINSILDDKCYFKDSLVNINLIDIHSSIEINNTYSVKDISLDVINDYSISTTNDLIITNSSCSTPCGDGSEFDTKVSSLGKFELNGAKLTEIDSYLMTDEKEYFSHGALSHIDPVYVSAGFNSEFAFKIDKGYNDFIDGSLPGADGFSLIFHTDNQHLNFKSDQYGGGMGFHNRKNAVALEIDLYNNDQYSDPDGNHIAFQVPYDEVLEAVHNDENTLGINSNIPIMKADGQDTYYCKLEYKDNNLKVWINNSQDYGDPTLDIPNFKFSDYLSLIEHSKVYVTLAAVTGTSYQKQEVIFWDWCSYYDPISSVEDNITENTITIYPNPSSDMIYIDGINYQENIELFDLTGQLILQQNYINGINISDLNRGIYILKLNNKNFKIIKE